MKAFNYFLTLTFVLVSFGAYAAKQCTVNITSLPTAKDNYNWTLIFSYASKGSNTGLITSYSPAKNTRPSYTGKVSFTIPCNNQIQASYGAGTSAGSSYYISNKCITKNTTIKWNNNSAWGTILKNVLLQTNLAANDGLMNNGIS